MLPGNVDFKHKATILKAIIDRISPLEMLIETQ